LLLQPVQVLLEPFLFGHAPDGLAHDEALVARPRRGASSMLALPVRFPGLSPSARWGVPLEGFG